MMLNEQKLSPLILFILIILLILHLQIESSNLFSGQDLVEVWSEDEVEEDFTLSEKEEGRILKIERELTFKDDSELVIDNPLENLVLVNKKRALPADFVAPDLTIVDIPFPFNEELDRKKMRREAAWMLEKLVMQAALDGISLFGISGYRSYQRQEKIFKQQALLRGEENAKWLSARPGHSEHQTGLAMDLSTSEFNYQLSEDFGESKAGKWLAEFAPYYGFIIRYPQDKEQITGYQYEPWHIRYVGTTEALEITERGLTLEEYLSIESLKLNLVGERAELKLELW